MSGLRKVARGLASMLAIVCAECAAGARAADELVQARHLAETADWGRACEIAQDLEKSDARDPGGKSLLIDFAQHLRPSESASLEQWESYAASLSEYVEHAPAKSLARTLQGRAWVQVAWRYRLTPEGTHRVREDRREGWSRSLNLAVACLDEVPSSERNVLWYEARLSAARGRQEAPAQMLQLAREGIARLPLPDAIFDVLLGNLSPRWGGDASAMLSAIDELSPQVPEAAARDHCLSTAYWVFFSAFGDDAGNHLDEARRAEITRVFDVRARRFPSPLVQDARAYVACQLGDRATAAEWFKRSFVPVSTLWSKGAWSYGDWRRWALGENTDDEQGAQDLAKALIGRWRTVAYEGNSSELTPEYFRANKSILVFTADGRRVEEYYRKGPERPSGSKTWEYRVVGPETFEYRKADGEWWQRHASIRDGRLHVRITGGGSTFIYEREPEPSAVP